MAKCVHDAPAMCTHGPCTSFPKRAHRRRKSPDVHTEKRAAASCSPERSRSGPESTCCVARASRAHIRTHRDILGSSCSRKVLKVEGCSLENIQTWRSALCTLRTTLAVLLSHRTLWNFSHRVEPGPDPEELFPQGHARSTSGMSACCWPQKSYKRAAAGGALTGLAGGM